jgi:RNA polymerase sigma-70 factor, ECF subfamily
VDPLHPLASELLAALLPAAPLARLVPDASLEGRLADLCRQARAAWPGVEVSDGMFLRYLAGKAQDLAAAEPVAALSELHTADLYLCCACLSGAAAAVAALEKLAVPRLPTQLARLRLSPSDLDEVAQLLRQHLLLPGAGPPKLQAYDGRSALTTWLRTVASRLALDHLRRGRPAHDDVSADDLPALGSALATTLQPELRHIEARYRGEVQQALLEAFSVISPDQRRLLREYYVDHRTTVQLAEKYRIHNANVGRRIQKALETVYSETERLLGERLGGQPQTLQSLIGLVRGQLHLSIDRVLGESSASTAG